MNIKKSRIIQIIKEEARKMMENDDDGLSLMPRLRHSQTVPTPAAEVEPEPQRADPNIQDLMFKIEKLMTRVAKLESMLKIKPSETDVGGDTVVGPLADLEEINNA